MKSYFRIELGNSPSDPSLRLRSGENPTTRVSQFERRLDSTAADVVAEPVDVSVLSAEALLVVLAIEPAVRSTG